MATAVKIKENKYGDAILLLAKMGGVFRTQHERTLIVGPTQKLALDEAGFVETASSPTRTEPTNGTQAKSG